MHIVFSEPSLVDKLVVVVRIIAIVILFHTIQLFFLFFFSIVKIIYILQSALALACRNGKVKELVWTDGWMVDGGVNRGGRQGGDAFDKISSNPLMVQKQLQRAHLMRYTTHTQSRHIIHEITTPIAGHTLPQTSIC